MGGQVVEGQVAGAPRVSVVVPVHDQELWLPGAVHSLLQSLTDWECVVVDDGSPGDVAAALGDALADARVRLERLPSNASRRAPGSAVSTVTGRSWPTCTCTPTA